MASDDRGSRQRRSGSVDINAGDAGLYTLIELRDEQTMSVEEIRADYGSGDSAKTFVEIYDEDSDVTPGEQTDMIDKLRLQPGDEKNPDMVWQDAEDDIIVKANGNQDAELTITVGGYIVSG